MARKKLTPNERIVFYNLVKYPNVSDRAVAEKSGAKISTVTAIKNRLKEQNYFKKLKTPCVYNLGYELFNASIWNMNPVSLKDSLLQDIRNHLNPTHSIAGISGNKMYMLNFGLNYTESHELTNKLDRIYWNNGLIDKMDDRCTKLLPFEGASIFSYFDDTPLLGKILGLEDNYWPEIITPETPAELKLSKLERKVFHALVENPEWPDTHIANAYDVTRQVVAKLKKRWEKQGMLKTSRSINLERLGMEIMEFTFVKIDMSQGQDKVVKALINPLKEVAPLFSMLSGYDLFYTTAHADYSSYQQTRFEFMRKLRKSGLYSEAPHTTVISLNNSKMRYDEIPLKSVRKLLNIEAIEGSHINTNKIYR